MNSTIFEVLWFSAIESRKEEQSFETMKDNGHHPGQCHQSQHDIPDARGKPGVSIVPFMAQGRYDQCVQQWNGQPEESGNPEQNGEAHQGDKKNQS